MADNVQFIPKSHKKMTGRRTCNLYLDSIYNTENVENSMFIKLIDLREGGGNGTTEQLTAFFYDTQSHSPAHELECVFFGDDNKNGG